MIMLVVFLIKYLQMYAFFSIIQSESNEKKGLFGLWDKQSFVL